MASLSVVCMTTPVTTTANPKTTFFSPLPAKPTLMVQRPNVRGLKVNASFKEKAITGLTAAALTASMMVPDVAEAGELAPSLKNLILSVVAGGAVLTAILGVVIAVSTFDPVKRVD